MLPTAAWRTCSGIKATSFGAEMLQGSDSSADGPGKASSAAVFVSASTPMPHGNRQMMEAEYSRPEGEPKGGT